MRRGNATMTTSRTLKLSRTLRTNFVADCQCDHCKQYRVDTLRLNSVSFPSDSLPYWLWPVILHCKPIVTPTINELKIWSEASWWHLIAHWREYSRRQPIHCPQGIFKPDKAILRLSEKLEWGGKIRFFHCGEYGDKTRRPHYHALIFGYGFPDKKIFKKQKSGDLFT
jgi:hypothetical protein